MVSYSGARKMKQLTIIVHFVLMLLIKQSYAFVFGTLLAHLHTTLSEILNRSRVVVRIQNSHAPTTSTKLGNQKADQPSRFKQSFENRFTTGT